MISTVLFLGLVNWLVTLILVESELTRPVREWVNGRRIKAEVCVEYPHRPREYRNIITCPWRCRAWGKAHYLVGCHLCAGTWVGFMLAAAFGGPLASGVVGVVSNGLLYKAVGHVTLEVTAALKRTGAPA